MILPRIIMTIFALSVGFLGLILMGEIIKWEIETHKRVDKKNLLWCIAIISFMATAVWAIWCYIQI